MPSQRPAQSGKLCMYRCRQIDPRCIESYVVVRLPTMEPGSNSPETPEVMLLDMGGAGRAGHLPTLRQQQGCAHRPRPRWSAPTQKPRHPAAQRDDKTLPSAF
ncbi:hypothetical protein ABBQ32_008910 [Trebouxia sp. C0010 RCD-2024]